MLVLSRSEARRGGDPRLVRVLARRRGRRLTTTRRAGTRTSRAGAAGSALDRILRAEAIGIACAGIGNLALAIAGRLGFPWPLEWIEGLTLAHALRIAGGDALYAPPAPEFVASIYPPLAYLPIALGVAVFGPHLVVARIPSVLATLGTLLLVGRATARAGGGRLGGLLAAGFFALGYGYCGAFYDLARVDAVFVLCVVAGVERLASDRPRAALALFGLSVFAKQQGLIFLLAATVWLAAREGRRRAPAIAAAWGGTLALLLVLHWTSDGWFTTYCFAIPAAHEVIWGSLAGFALEDLLLALPVLAIAALATSFRMRREPRAVDACLIAALAVGALGRVHAGGFANVLVPGFALLVIVGIAALAPALLDPAARPRVRVAVGLALLAQALLLFRPAPLDWPRPGAAERYREFVAALERCARGRPAVALDYAGIARASFAHSMPLADLWKTGDPGLVAAGSRALARGLLGPSAPGAIAVGWRLPELDAALARGYRVCERVASPPVATGYQPEDATIYARIAP